MLQSVATGIRYVDTRITEPGAYRDNWAQAVLEEVLKGPKSVIRALAGNALPEAPAHIHVHTYGHHYQQWVPKVVITQQDESSLQSTAEPDNKFKTTLQHHHVQTLPAVANCLHVFLDTGK